MLAVKLLAIDKGNSRTKVGLQNEKGDLNFDVFTNDAESNLLEFLKEASFDYAIISSVVAGNNQAIASVVQAKAKVLELDYLTPIPIKNNYATPETLGVDRIAGAVGAWFLAGKQDVLLIDAGTCINYECVIDGAYLGGAISPGLRMRLMAMHEFTGKLPLLEIPEPEIALIGNSTATCMLSGALHGVTKELTGIAERYIMQYPAITVVLSGGDSSYLGKYLKNSIFAPHQEVVLIGLMEILKFNLHV